MTTAAGPERPQFQMIGLIVLALFVSLLLLLYGGAKADSVADQQEEAARALVSEIAADLEAIRDIGGALTAEDNLTVAVVEQRLIYLNQVDQKLTVLHSEFADTDIIEQRATRRLVERHRAQLDRMHRLQSRLNTAVSLSLIHI